MHITHYHLSTFVGLAAILTLGCDNDSTGPTTEPTGSIEITVATQGADIDVDSDGYSLHIGGAGSQAVGVNAIVTVADLPTFSSTALRQTARSAPQPVGLM